MSMTLQIEAVYQRALVLRQLATETPVQYNLLEASLKELTFVLEELQTSEEEVRRQNQTVIATRQQVETERNRYQELFNLAPDGYLVTDKSGTIQEANAAIASMLNMLQSFLIGKPMAVFISEIDRPVFYATLDQLKHAGSSYQPQTQRWELQICPRHGTPLDVAIALSITYDFQGSVVSLLWQLRDITQQKQIKVLLEHLNTQLERQVQERTAQLQQALEFEASLKRITDNVRDSLDEAQIMQTVVRELAKTLEISCCNASLYDLEQDMAIICYEYTQMSRSYKNRAIRISNNLDIYSQILKHQVVQYCPIHPDPERGSLVMMAVPIVDNQHVLGDLWLIQQNSDLAFSERDIRLVQQVANQCAIAIRQARLYQASQHQVKELEQVNQLKDTFLSTVSHELRTPLSNMNMAIRMLNLIVKQPDHFDDKQLRLTRYLEILQTQCYQEIALINDLLDLSRMDANAEPLVLAPLDLTSWLPQIMIGFEVRMHAQQQSLRLEIAPDLPPLTTDASLLHRIVTELVNNACKYTPPDHAIAITASAVDQTLQLSISNSGVNLSVSELDRLFDKFYRVPSHDPWKHGGTGLGLALVKQHVAQLGGAIAVTNLQGWITFTLQIPWKIADPKISL